METFPVSSSVKNMQHTRKSTNTSWDSIVFVTNNLWRLCLHICNSKDYTLRPDLELEFALLHHVIHLVLRLCAHGHYPHLLGLELPKQLIELLEVLLQIRREEQQNSTIAHCGSNLSPPKYIIIRVADSS